MTVTVPATIIKRDGVLWWELSEGPASPTIEQHELHHVSIFYKNGELLESLLKDFIGQCLSGACLDATKAYIDWLQSYVYWKNLKENATFDCNHYSDIGPGKKIRCKDAAEFTNTMNERREGVKTADVKRIQACT